MLETWGRFVARRAALVLSAGLIAVVAAAVFGVGVFGSLSDGMNAATTLPKITKHKRKTIGIDSDSARAMSALTVSLTSPNTAHCPATFVVSPTASRVGSTSS